jgi:hypothetical protein
MKALRAKKQDGASAADAPFRGNDVDSRRILFHSQRLILGHRLSQATQKKTHAKIGRAAA